MQLVPALSPPLGGVGDYALGIAERLEAEFKIGSEFLACNPEWSGSNRKGSFVVRTLRERSAARLGNELHDIFSEIESKGCSGKQVVLLQLSPYGYERNGCPFWLARGLRSWIDRAPEQRKLITMFHELYAAGPPWSKAFWLSGLQKQAVRGVLASTSFAMTNMRRYARELEAWGGTGIFQIRHLPVPSNVGEPTSVPILARRARRICVFGVSPGLRRPSDQEQHLLRQAVRSWPIEEIALIGSTPHPDAFDGIGCNVVTHRGLPAAQVGGILEDSVLGLLWYPAEALGKSTIYAAYCAHGVPTMLMSVSGRRDDSLDGPIFGSHYITAGALGAPWDANMLQQVADGARSWYPAHSLSAHASMVAAGVESVCA